jgi:hypothetical protein
VERFIFCATTGRSGTSTLATILAAGDGNVSSHEPFPQMNSYVLRAAAAGRRSVVRAAWHGLKLPAILIAARQSRIYIETNHQFLKVFANLAYQEFGSRLTVIHLVRNRLAVARSLYELGQIPGTHAASRWLPNPLASTNAVPFPEPGGDELNHPLHRCLWYCVETEVRAAAARQSFEESDWVDLGVEELGSEAAMRQLDETLNLRLSDRAYALIGKRFNRKPKRSRQLRQLSDEEVEILNAEFVEFYASWIHADHLPSQSVGVTR